ncbi:D-alanyl-D-alanine endopeptidase [Cellvibrio sp. ARAG 10.3]|uniref:D-alanyl-D-alanine endopeptidase n=1 Tax=Cellvibrio sp. ARAG 10.3 TaxID=3451358 RepID=UPI003F44A2B0
MPKFCFLIVMLLSLPGLAQAQLPLPDPAALQLASVHALVMDLDTSEILYARNPDAIVPIASLTKLMTAMVVLDDLEDAPLDEWIAVNVAQTEEMKNVFSHVRIGSQLQRRDMLLLALMASENRAAATLAYHYSGGYAAFIAAMNSKAKTLGMSNSRFVEPTGLSSDNVSTPRDLALLIQTSARNPLLAELSITPKKDIHFRAPNHVRAFYNTNPLVRGDNWRIEASKTGYLNQAGRCLVLQAEIQKRHLAIVLLDSFGKRSHIGDAARIRRWLETGDGGAVHPSALEYMQRRQKILLASGTAL